MNTKTQRLISEAFVEKMLRLKKIPVDDVPCETMEAMALTLSGHASLKELEQVNRHLEQCELCRASLLWHSQMTAQSVLSPLIRKDPSPRSVVLFKRPAPFLFAAAAALIAVVIGIQFLKPVELTRPSDVTMVTKGFSDEMFVAVKRGELEFVLKPGDKLQQGDAVGLFYSAESAGYAAVFNLDSHGEATLLFPSGKEKSARIDAAKKAPLPDGAQVQEGAGCEWLVGVFSEREFDLRAVKKKVESAAMNSTECRLHLAIPDTRSVIVIPFSR